MHVHRRPAVQIVHTPLAAQGIAAQYMSGPGRSRYTCLLRSACTQRKLTHMRAAAITSLRASAHLQPDRPGCVAPDTLRQQGERHCTSPTDQLMAISSVLNTSVALGGMTPPAPASPYPSSGGIVSVRFSPTHMPSTPWSQPLMTCPAPSLKGRGWPRSYLHNVRLIEPGQSS